MAYRNVFFSFDWDQDVWRAMVVRNSGILFGVNAAGFRDAAEIEEVKHQSDAAIKRWIDSQLSGTTVTVVLLGAKTYQSRWVKYECDASIARDNGIVFIDISDIADQYRRNSSYGGMPAGWPEPSQGSTSPYLFFRWETQHSPLQFGTWVEQAALNVGK